MNAVDITIGLAPAIARSLTVPLTARSPIVPPGNTIGLTTKESVEKARRVFPMFTTAESPIPASAAGPNAGRKRCSISSPDMAPPPPCPITMLGASRSGAGHTHDSMSICASGIGHLEPPVKVVRRACTLGRDHGRAQRISRCAQCAERGALMRFDVTLQHLAGTAHR